MPTAWRVIKKKYERHALTGEGAHLYGGRWNSPGHRVIYTAEALSGALLEILVHSDKRLLPYYSVYRFEVPEQNILDLDVSSLPTTWRRSPAPPELAAVGDRWYTEGQSVVLRVPSVIVPVEKSLLINPAHPNFSAIGEVCDGPFPFDVDPRLR